MKPDSASPKGKMHRREFEWQLPLEDGWLWTSPLRFFIDYRVEGGNVEIVHVMVEGRPDDSRRDMVSKLYSMTANPALRLLGEQVKDAVLRDEAWTAATKFWTESGVA